MTSVTALVLALTGVLLIKWTVQALNTGAAEQVRHHLVQNKQHCNCAGCLGRHNVYYSIMIKGVCSLKQLYKILTAGPLKTRPGQRPVHTSVMQVPNDVAWPPLAAMAAGIGLVPASKLAVVATGVAAALALRSAAHQPKSTGTHAVTWRADRGPLVIDVPALVAFNTWLLANTLPATSCLL